MASPQTIFRPADDVEAEIVGTEMVLYHPTLTSAIYLNPTAALIWGLCDGQRSVHEITGIIANTYPDAGPTLADEVGETVDRLQQNGVLLVR